MQGFYNVYALVTMPNQKSEGIHESFGFETVGIFKKTGFKFGRWHDVRWYGLKPNEQPDFPQPPQSIGEILASDSFKQVLEKAEQMIK